MVQAHSKETHEQSPKRKIHPQINTITRRNITFDKEKVKIEALELLAEKTLNQQDEALIAAAATGERRECNE
ncbi:hypothetical protein L195_g046959 [Trifolium pratense]|uniref:Uncharacterized protein n=1 Tax=Trifolium pratense TaxID=57577 RepID=A0A2K3MJ79_TRIPR|nr:hypothetical protein L195_g046959 [Trifolium pratense]